MSETSGDRLYALERKIGVRYGDKEAPMRRLTIDERLDALESAVADIKRRLEALERWQAERDRADADRDRRMAAQDGE